MTYSTSAGLASVEAMSYRPGRGLESDAVDIGSGQVDESIVAQRNVTDTCAAVLKPHLADVARHNPGDDDFPRPQPRCALSATAQNDHQPSRLA
jgi:hypothetical protein